ncbi:MAG: hypothetical protein ABW143_08650, partial [Acidimicrobiales bacterium]
WPCWCAPPCSGLPSCSDDGDIAQEGTGAPIGTDQDLVLVDTTAVTVTNLGRPAPQYSVALAAAQPAVAVPVWLAA